jgi:dTDP-D-glucose 4,6-dehydratase
MEQMSAGTRKRLLVTGGMGFIGSNFVRLLLAERPEWEVWNLDLLTYAANPENLSDVAPEAERAGGYRYRFVRGDIADAETMQRLFAEGGFHAVEVYNFGGASERRNLEVVRRIAQAVGASEELVRFVTDRPGHDRRYAIDFSRATRELGWAPTRTFEAGLEETVRWYQENLPWWERVRDGAYRQSAEMIASWKGEP